MKSIFFAIFIIAFQVINTLSIAQDVVSTENYKLDLELVEIKRERLLIDSKFKTNEADCYKTFAVNLCLQERKSEKLLELTDIKRRELIVNERKRQIKSEAADKKFKEKSEKLINKTQSIETTRASKTSDKKAEQSNLSNNKRETSTPKDQVKLAEQRSAVAKQRVIDSNIKHAASQRKAQSRAKKLTLAAENEAKFNQKQHDAQVHKTAIEKASAEKLKSKSAPLPIPALNALKQ